MNVGKSRRQKVRLICLWTVDDQYQALGACFDRVEKVGKPPKSPTIVFHNWLLLQLNKLKDEKGKMWYEIEQFS